MERLRQLREEMAGVERMLMRVIESFERTHGGANALCEKADGPKGPVESYGGLACDAGDK